MYLLYKLSWMAAYRQREVHNHRKIVLGFSHVRCNFHLVGINRGSNAQHGISIG